MAGKTNNTENHRNTGMASYSVINSSFDEKQWLVWIEELIQRDLDEAMKVPASIFLMPESTSKHNPESYIPNGVALGPYHHFLPELFRMEVYKLHKAKLARTKFQLPQFRHLVNEIRQRELTIRACFYKFIPMESETFAWVMVIDGLYLIWLLGICTDIIGNPGDLTAEKTPVKILAAYEVERDVLQLENQIPMEVLLRIMTANRPDEDYLLTIRLFNYCVIVSPFELASSCLDLGLLAKSYHLLHFLYNSILIPGEIEMRPQTKKKQRIISNCLIQLLDLLGSISGVGFFQLLSESLDSLKTLSDIRENGRNLFAFEEKPDPLIPSASKLAKVGIGFKPTQVGIKGVNFRRRRNKLTFELPLIRVNYFSEIILRNLVAFEATYKMGPPVLARYIGLMNGLVETPEDVKILKTARIISNDLGGGDEEVVELFSRVWKYAVDVVNSAAEESGDDEEGEAESSFERGLLAVKRDEEEGHAEKLVSLPILGKRIKVIEDVNSYYYSLKKVKIKKFFKKYVLSSVKIIFLAVLFCILILIILRTICSFFSCPRFLKSS